MEERRGAFLEAGDALFLGTEDAFDDFQAADDVVQAFILEPAGAEDRRYQGEGDLEDGQEFGGDGHLMGLYNFRALAAGDEVDLLAPAAGFRCYRAWLLAATTLRSL